jgi:dTMP kinase
VTAGWRLPLQPHGLPGKLIAFDGVDGSGKTTTTRLTRAYLRAQGQVVRGYKLPSRDLKRMPWFRRYSADPIGTGRTGEVDPLGMCCAVLGDRLLTLRRSILPQLRAGRTVVVDRYLFTPLGELLIHHADRRARAVVEPLVGCFPRPDLSVFTTVPAQEAMARVRSRPAEASDPLPADVYSRRIRAFRELAESNDGLLLDTSAGIRSTFEALIPPLLASLLPVSPDTTSSEQEHGREKTRRKGGAPYEEVPDQEVRPVQRQQGPLNEELSPAQGS